MIPALCCECGTQRQVRRGAATTSHNRRLKCATCGRSTLHALSLPPGVCDWRERENERGRSRVDAAPNLLESVADRYSIRIIEVDDLPRVLCWVPEVSIVLVQSGLSGEERARAGSWLMKQQLKRGVVGPRSPRAGDVLP